MPTKQELEEELERIKEKERKRYAKQNKRIKENYKRVSIAIPIDIYDRLLAVDPDVKMNGLLNKLLLDHIQEKEIDKSGCSF